MHLSAAPSRYEIIYKYHDGDLDRLTVESKEAGFDEIQGLKDDTDMGMESITLRDHHAPLGQQNVFTHYLRPHLGAIEEEEEHDPHAFQANSSSPSDTESDFVA